MGTKGVRLSAAGLAGGMVMMFLLAAQPARAQGTTPQPPAPQSKCTGKDCPPTDVVPAAPQPRPPESLPNSPGNLKREITSAIRVQPPCQSSQAPCELTPRQKFQLFVKRTYSPYTFVGGAFDAGYSQLTDEKYGPGVEGFAKRYGATLADGETRSFFQTFVYSSLLHQDPRYHRLGKGNVLYRAAYAGSRVFVGRSDAGRRVFNTPEMLGSVTTSAIGNLYYPDRDRSVGRTFGRAFGGLGSDAGVLVLREFLPDMKRWFRRHEPATIRRIDRRVSGKGAPAKPSARPSAEPSGEPSPNRPADTPPPP